MALLYKVSCLNKQLISPLFVRVDTQSHQFDRVHSEILEDTEGGQTPPGCHPQESKPHRHTRLLEVIQVCICSVPSACSKTCLKCNVYKLVSLFEESRIPRYLYVFTILIVLDSILNTMPFEDRLNTIALHFPQLKDIWFSLAQRHEISNSFCMFLGLSEVKTMSSAKPRAEILDVPRRAPYLEEHRIQRY